MGVGYFFADIELSMELWTVISGISGFDDWHHQWI